MNVSSMVGRIGTPYVSAYSAAKFAVRGLSQSLREELRHDRGINVCTILPAAIDTPFFQHAANYSGKAVKPVRPVHDPETVAAAIAGCIVRPRAEVLVGRAGKGLVALERLSPGAAERVLGAQAERDHFANRDASSTSGNLYEPMPGWNTVYGDWARSENRRLRIAGLAGAGAAAWVAVRARRRG